MQTIKLRFAKNKTFISWLVRVFTNSQWSHVDYIFDDGRAFSCLPKSGVGFNDDVNDETVTCEVEVKSKKEVEEFLLSQEGKPYDWKAIVAFLAIRKWHDRDAWFCSELIATAISISNGTPMFNEDMSRITPKDLFIHPTMKVIE